MIAERLFYGFHEIRMAKRESRGKQMILLMRLKFTGYLVE
jgi:hypothetical protein